MRFFYLERPPRGIEKGFPHIDLCCVGTGLLILEMQPTNKQDFMKVYNQITEIAREKFF